MRKRKKGVFIFLVSLVALLLIAFEPRPILLFTAMQADSSQHAGTWEDDPKNWYRAFNEEQPAQVKVIHSKYGKSR